MKLSVIIVNYNVCYYLEQCLVSVLRATEGIACEIVVVDNHSEDGSVAYLQKRFGHQITMIESQHNVGFARANNMAIRQTTGDYVLLLNPDTFVAESAIKEVLTFMDSHPKAGGVGVMMHNADGTLAPESRRGLPTPSVSFLKMIGLSKRYYLSHLPWDQPGAIDVMSGAFCMLRRDALNKVGLLDEDFFMYGEDIDLSYRILKGGYENWYVPARIVHYKGESTKKSSFTYVHVFYQAMLIFFRKHFGHLSFLVSIPVKLAVYFRALLALVQIQYDRLRRGLGFVDMKTDASPAIDDFAFVGSEAMLDECRQLVCRKGLKASFHQTLSDVDRNSCRHVAYDTSTFSFEQIIDDMAKNSMENHTLATYSPDSHVLITPTEIIR